MALSHSGLHTNFFMQIRNCPASKKFMPKLLCPNLCSCILQVLAYVVWFCLFVVWKVAQMSLVTLLFDPLQKGMHFLHVTVALYSTSS